MREKIKINEFIEKVKEKISKKCFKLIFTYVKKKASNLWKEQKPSLFFKHMVALTIYKDLYTKDYKTSYKLIVYNIQAIIIILKE